MSSRPFSRFASTKARSGVVCRNWTKNWFALETSPRAPSRLSTFPATTPTDGSAPKQLGNAVPGVHIPALTKETGGAAVRPQKRG